MAKGLLSIVCLVQLRHLLLLSAAAGVLLFWTLLPRVLRTGASLLARSRPPAWCEHLEKGKGLYLWRLLRYSILTSSVFLCLRPTQQALPLSWAGSVKILIVDIALLQVSVTIAQHYTILVSLVRHNRQRHAVHGTVLGQNEHCRAVIFAGHVAYIAVRLLQMWGLERPVYYAIE